MLKLLRHRGYDRAAIKSALSPALATTTLQRRDGAAATSVLLKPNFVMPAPRGDASTTHPEFYMAIAELMLERGLRVGIGESPAIGSCTQALRAHGVLDECRERGIEVVDFRRAERYQGVADIAGYRTLTVAGELAQWDAIINLPKLKTHQQFVFTAASKNLYGCVSGKRKFLRHNLCRNDPVRFARMLLANAGRVGCALHICDAIEAMHVRGPRGGKAYPLGHIVLADDHLAHDWLCCRLIGLPPAQTPLFAALDEVGRARLEEVCAPLSGDPGFRCAHDFVHAPQIHISFSPWAMARSGYRRLRHAFDAARS